ncbi:MAG: hypothetical protein ACYS21_16020 [Planctomycetota bacterium]|jgi:hypothetical protein
MMKRLLIVLCVVGFLATLSLSHSVLAKPPEDKPAKVLVCHVTDSVVVNAADVSLVVGHVINVSENAVDAHVAHGDILAINDIDSAGPFSPLQSWRDIAVIWNLNTAGANCAGFRLP